MSRKLAAILFADVVGYTSLMQKDEGAATTQLRRFQSSMEKEVASHLGEIVNFYGDGALCIFQSPLDAMRCAIALQTGFRKDAPVPVRIGLHSGTIVQEGGKAYGDSVNVASRIESVGIPGSILFSKRVRDELKNQPDLSMVSLGTFEFKNVAQPLEVFALTNEGIIVPKKSDIRRKLNPDSANQKKWMIPAALAFLVLGTFSIWQMSSGSKTLSSESLTSTSSSTTLSQEMRDKRVAVMFFENKSLNPELDALGEMISDWLTQRLMVTGEAQMVNAAFVRNKINLAGIGFTASPSFSKETGADVVIQGKYYLIENQLSIHAQIVDASNGNILFALPTLQGEREKAMDLLHELTERLTSFWVLQDQGQFNKNPPKYEAYEEYLKYREYFSVDDTKTLEILTKAYELDTTFFQPILLAVRMYTNKSIYSKSDSLIQWIKGKQPQLSAWEQLELTSSESLIHGDRELFTEGQMTRMKMDNEETFLAGHAHLYYMNQPQRSLEIYQTKYTPDYKYEACPSCQWALGRMMDAHLKLEQYKEAVELIEALSVPLVAAEPAYHHLQALVRLGDETELKEQIAIYEKQDLKWFNWHHPALLYWMICREYFLIGKTEKVNEYAQLFFQVHEEFPPPTNWFDGKGQVYFSLGDYQNALTHFQKMEGSPTGIAFVDFPIIAMIGACHAKLGDTSRAHDYVQLLKQHDEELNLGFSHYYQALIYVHLGDKEMAIEQLQFAVDEGIYFHWTYFKSDILLKPLFGYPPFEELVSING